jgi:hypothetical protein
MGCLDRLRSNTGSLSAYWLGRSDIGWSDN